MTILNYQTESKTKPINIENSLINKNTTNNLIPSDEVLKENLIYLLIGFKSTQLFENDEECSLEINPSYPNPTYIYPFIPLIESLKVLRVFIAQCIYNTDMARTILSEFFEIRLDKFQKKAVKLLDVDFEKVFVTLYPFMEEFVEYSGLIKTIDGSSVIDILNILNGRFEITEKYYKDVIEGINEKLSGDISRWCLYGEIENDFFIIENQTELQFDESFWKNAYRIAAVVPTFFESRADKIFACGMMQKIIRKFAPDEILLSESEVNIEKLYNTTKQVFDEGVISKLHQSIEHVYKCYFLTSNTWLIDMFNTLENKIFYDYDIINDYLSIHLEYKFKRVDTRITDYILKILNVERQKEISRSNIFENLLINEYDDLFSTFFSKKMIFEIEIIFRFLYQLCAFEHVYMRFPNNNFVIKVRLFLQYFRSTLHLNYIGPFKVILEERGDNIITEFTNFVKIMLRQLYFTDLPNFSALNKIFDIMFDFIYVKGSDESYLQNFNLAVNNFVVVLKKSDISQELVFMLGFLIK